MNTTLDTVEQILDGTSLAAADFDVTGLEVIDIPDYLPRMGGGGSGGC